MNSMGPKKQFGQHFLTSVRYAERIAESVAAQENENVLEIGPGNGALTAHLVKRFPELHCVEIDEDVSAALEIKIGQGRWTLHKCDALSFEFKTVGFPLHVVGNLPYNIGALLIKKTLLYGNDISTCTFMVQREVAQRIAAGPHTKESGFLTIFCQFFGKPKILFHVPPGAFFPRPSVDSTVFSLRIDRNLDTRLPASRWNDYFSFVDKGFRTRRKMLANVLGAHGGRDKWTLLLDKLGIVRTSRAEDLSAEEWLNLYKLSCDIP